MESCQGSLQSTAAAGLSDGRSRQLILKRQTAAYPTAYSSVPSSVIHIPSILVHATQAECTMVAWAAAEALAVYGWGTGGKKRLPVPRSPEEAVAARSPT